MDFKIVAAKLTVSAFFAALVTYLDALIVPIIILITVVICDYISGLGKAYIVGDLSSRTGIKGIIKKLCYFMAVAVAMGVDWLISLGFMHIGLDIKDNMVVALIVIVWLVINELLSILENLAIIGVPLPKFLMSITKKLKVVAENTVKTSTDNEDNSIDISDLYGIQHEIYNHDETVDLGSIELWKNDTREYLLDSTDVDKLNLLEKAEDGSTAWCTDTHELYVKHNNKWIKQ